MEMQMDSFSFRFTFRFRFRLELIFSPIRDEKMKSEPCLWAEPFKSLGRWLATGSIRFVSAPERLTCSSDP